MGDSDGQTTSAAADVESLARQVHHDVTALGVDWWHTWTADTIVDLARIPPFVTALAGIIEVLREGGDPDWVVGGVTANAAFAVAQEWLDAGVDAGEVGDWLRAGCWDPKAARRMVDLGLRPDRLIADGKPIHLVDVGPDGEIPLASAVADSYLTIQDAVRHVVRHYAAEVGPPGP